MKVEISEADLQKLKLDNIRGQWENMQLYNLVEPTLNKSIESISCLIVKMFELFMM